MSESVYRGIKFTDADVVDPHEHIPWDDCNPHNVRPWLLHDHGFVVAVVFASNTQDALDNAADSKKLDRYLVDEKTITREELVEKYTCLGNASEFFDIESLEIVELPNPKYSFTALFNANKE